MLMRAERVSPGTMRGAGVGVLATPYFILKYKKRGDQKIKLAAVIPASVEKSAVRRNFWKRRIVSCVRDLSPLGWEMLFIATPGMRPLTVRQLKEALVAGVKKIRT